MAGPKTGLTTSTGLRGCGRPPPFPHGALRNVVPTQGTTLQGGARRNVAAERRHAGAKWSTKRGPHSTPTSCGPRRAANSAPQMRRLSTCSRVWISAHLARPNTHRRPACLSFSSLATLAGPKVTVEIQGRAGGATTPQQVPPSPRNKSRGPILTIPATGRAHRTRAPLTQSGENLKSGIDRFTFQGQDTEYAFMNLA